MSLILSLRPWDCYPDTFKVVVSSNRLNTEASGDFHVFDLGAEEAD